MSAGEAFEKWLRDWASRNPGADLQLITVWHVACRWAIEQAAQSSSDEAEESEALKSCPCCGGGASFDHDDDGWNWIVCGNCGLSTDCAVSLMDDCRPKLREKWNRRKGAQS